MNSLEIAFFVSEGNGEYTRVENNETLADIYEAFGDTFRIAVLSYNHNGQNFTNPAATLIPATYIDANRVGPHLYMEMGQEHCGVYMIVGEGTINGEKLYSESTMEWDARTEILFEYDAENTEASFISQLNAFLAALPNMEQYKALLEASKGAVTVYLPEGTFEGYIEVPAALGWNHVNIYGKKEANSNGPGYLSTIKGGIINNNGAVHSWNVTFEGAGGGDRNAETWTNGVNAGTANIPPPPPKSAFTIPTNAPTATLFAVFPFSIHTLHPPPLPKKSYFLRKGKPHENNLRNFFNFYNFFLRFSRQNACIETNFILK